METIRGVVSGVGKDEGIGKNGKPYTRYVFTINEKKYSTFDEKIGESFKVGDDVTITGEKNGAFFNMKTMILSKQVPVESLPKEQTTLETPKNDLVVDLLRQILAELKGLKTNGNN